MELSKFILEDMEGILSVHNEGEPIAERLLDRVFEPLVRGERAQDGSRSAASQTYAAAGSVFKTPLLHWSEPKSSGETTAALIAIPDGGR